MNYWWKANKRFASAVGGGLLLTLVWHFFFMSPLAAGTKSLLDKRTFEERKLRSAIAAGVPAEESVQRARGDRDQLVRDIKAVRDESEFAIENAFKSADGRPPGEGLRRLVQEVRRLVEERARQKNFPQIDQRLGFGGSIPELQDDVYREWMKRLAIVQRLCLLAIEHGEKIESLSAIQEQQQEAPDIRADRFLNRLTVKIKFKATGEGVTRFVHALQGRQGKGTFLAIEDFKATQDDTSRDLLAVEMAVSGIFVNPEAPAAPSEKKE